MAEHDCEKIKDSLISIASELFRFQRVFEKAISKLDMYEKEKYKSQYTWFSKTVSKALEDANLKVVSLDGQLYDVGMAVTPLNIEDFEINDVLYVEQTMEPIIMQNDFVIKTGTVILGRKEK